VVYALYGSKSRSNAAIGPEQDWLFLAIGLPIMSRSRKLIGAVLFLAAFLVVGRLIIRCAVHQVSDPAPSATGGRLQIVADEQDVGLVPQGMPLDVEFVLANTGDERLVLRQAPHECCPSEAPHRTFTIEPGQTGQILASLSADDLLGRGRKHIRFDTSDPTTPELWLTVRGSVVRRTMYEGGRPVEHSVLVK
jgi:Protein of unknown function (DUF1573)